jgi:hypothetical protein
VDAGGVVRVFRHTLMPYENTVKQVGGGMSINTRYGPTATSHLLAQLTFGPGLGAILADWCPT